MVASTATAADEEIAAGMVAGCAKEDGEELSGHAGFEGGDLREYNT